MVGDDGGTKEIEQRRGEKGEGESQFLKLGTNFVFAFMKRQ